MLSARQTAPVRPWSKERGAQHCAITLRFASCLSKVISLYHGRITKLDAVLDCAIRLLDTEDIEAHTLAWAAFNVMFEMLGKDATSKVVHRVKKNLQLGKVPGFLRHAGDANAILPEHSPETAYLTIVLAIRLWEARGEKLTEAMRKFGKRPNPYEPGYRHETVVEAARHQPLSDLGKGLTKPLYVKRAGPLTCLQNAQLF